MLQFSSLAIALLSMGSFLLFLGVLRFMLEKYEGPASFLFLHSAGATSWLLMDAVRPSYSSEFVLAVGALTLAYYCGIVIVVVLALRQWRREHGLSVA